MKLIQLVNARLSLQKLVEQDLPLKSAYALYQLVIQANKHLEYYGEEISKPDCNAEELENTEIDIMANKIIVPVSDRLTLSAADVKNLEPFAYFEVIR